MGLRGGSGELRGSGNDVLEPMFGYGKPDPRPMQDILAERNKRVHQIKPGRGGRRAMPRPGEGSLELIKGTAEFLEPGYVHAARTGTVPPSIFGKAVLAAETVLDFAPGLGKGIVAGSALAGSILKAGKPAKRAISPRLLKGAKKSILKVRENVVHSLSHEANEIERMEKWHDGPFPSGMTEDDFLRFQFDNSDSIMDLDFESVHFIKEDTKDRANFLTSTFSPQTSHQNLRDLKADVIKNMRTKNVPNEIIAKSTSWSGRDAPKPSLRKGMGKFELIMANRRQRKGLMSNEELFSSEYNRGRKTIIEFEPEDLNLLRQAEKDFKAGRLNQDDMKHLSEQLKRARRSKEVFDLDIEQRRSIKADRAVQVRRMQHRADMKRGYGFRYGRNPHPDVTRKIKGKDK